MALFHKLRRLSRNERLLFVEAWKIVALTRLMLWVFPLEKVRKKISRRKTFARLQPLESTTWAVCAASHRIPRATCLVQAIALQTLLQEQGISTYLVIGVTMGQEDNFQSHAWVEHEGRILIGASGSGDFQQVLRLESQTKAL